MFDDEVGDAPDGEPAAADVDDRDAPDHLGEKSVVEGHAAPYASSRTAARTSAASVSTTTPP